MPLNCASLRLAKFQVAVVAPEVPVKTDVHQPIDAAPAVCVDDAADVGFARNDGLQRGFGGVGDNFCVDAIAAFEQTEDDGNDWAKFRFADFRTPKSSIFRSHNIKSACYKSIFASQDPREIIVCLAETLRGR